MKKSLKTEEININKATPKTFPFQSGFKRAGEAEILMGFYFRNKVIKKFFMVQPESENFHLL